MITPLWLSGLWRSFLYSFSVYFCHPLLISSASVRSIPFLFFIEPIFAWNVSLLSIIFLKRSLVYPILLFSSISLHWSLRKAFLSLLAILSTLHSNGYIFPFLLCFLLLFFSQLFARHYQLFCFYISFPWGLSCDGAGVVAAMAQGQTREATPTQRSVAAAERSHPTSKVRSRAALCWSSHEEIRHMQGKRSPSKIVGSETEHQRTDRLKPQSQKTSQSDHMNHSSV